MPDMTLQIRPKDQPIWDAAARIATEDQIPLANVVTLALYAYLRQRTAHTPPPWRIEVHTYQMPSDDGCYMEEYPTGWATFRCTCGTKVFDRTKETVGKAREHIRTDHPTWEQMSADEPEADR